MACQIHEGKQKIMVCVGCNSPVCELCIEETHYGHLLKSFDTVAKSIIDDLLASKESPGFIKHEKSLQDLVALCQTKGCQALLTKKEIQARHDEIKQLLDKVTETAETKLDQHHEWMSKELDKVKATASAQIQKIQDFKDKVGRLQTLQNPLEIFEHGQRIKAPDVERLNFPEVYRLSFVSPGDGINMEGLFGELKIQDLNLQTTFQQDRTTATPVLGQHSHNSSPDSSVNTLDLFGDGPEEDTLVKTHVAGSTDAATQLQSKRSQSFKCHIKLTPKHSFKLSHTARDMKPTAEGKCWVKCHDDNIVKLVGTSGDVENEIQCNSPVLDFAVIPGTNRLFVTFTTENVIKQIHVTQDGRDPIMSTLIRIGPLRPCFMCVTHNGDILVTLTNKTSWSVEPNSTTVLVKYNSNGRELARVHKDCHDEDLFFVSDGLSIDNSGAVVVINATTRNPTRSHLVLLDNKLNLRVRYISPGVTVAAVEQMPQQTEKFWISGVVFNQHNLLLVSEFYSRTVQLLDPACNPLKVLVTEHQAPPRTLAMLADGDLWVGLWGGAVQVYKHICEFTHEEK